MIGPGRQGRPLNARTSTAIGRTKTPRGYGPALLAAAVVITWAGWYLVLDRSGDRKARRHSACAPAHITVAMTVAASHTLARANKLIGRLHQCLQYRQTFDEVKAFPAPIFNAGPYRTRAVFDALPRCCRGRAAGRSGRLVVQRGSIRDADDQAVLREKPGHRLTPRLSAGRVQ
jgi:hypothetical protein